jgi:hypothetical protein
MASPFDASLLEVQVAGPSLLRRLDSVLSVAYLGWRMSTPGAASCSAGRSGDGHSLQNSRLLDQ